MSRVTIGGIEYTLNGDNTAIVEGSSLASPTNITIPNTFTSGNILYTVGSIRQGAFLNKTTITSISLPTTTIFTDIGTNAFYNTSISQIIIPANVSVIGASVCQYCSNLSKIYFYGTTIPIIIYSENHFLNIKSGATFYYVSGTDLTGLKSVYPTYNYVLFDPNEYPCFKEDSLILTNKGYRRIQELRKGDLVKTLLNGFLKIDMIGKKEIVHKACVEDRIKDQLYKCSHENFEEVFEPLVLTGCHSILVDEFVSEEQKQKAIEINENRLCVTDRKYRLPACVDERTTVYEIPGTYTIYHLALENPDYYMNYGIYANGLLVETCSKRYLKELSGMELIQ
jgi:hypothetical protein